VLDEFYIHILSLEPRCKHFSGDASPIDNDIVRGLCVDTHTGKDLPVILLIEYDIYPVAFFDPVTALWDEQFSLSENGSNQKIAPVG